MSKIVVIGSSSIDLVVSAERRPKAGETVIGESFKTVPGGKGANQAVAASRLGAQVYMVGCVGDDNFGKVILDNFKENEVIIDCVKPVTGVESGTAHITLAEGDNSIIVVKGANNYVTPEYVNQARNIIESAEIVLIQQEIPEETVEFVADMCKELDVPLLLNPVPARVISQSVIEKVAYLTPNEHEASILFKGLKIGDVLKKYPNKLFITEGIRGVRYHNGEKEVLIPTFEVETVDTTGAGDTFNAAFAVALAEGQSIEESVRFANRAASLSVTKFGAQGGMPSRAEVEGCLKK
ncbi:ribokinase [Heyndrickxia sporothermodurans]|uniref:ribokinase n=1 Tax=Heyndrickxia sporothermodurans TaxID=46224 RepID=UPI002E1C06DD|nr:ribokinase [Heyndrickxia sporothermodurans]MED3652557.1 ribokinase [Heyndrickxia sporothermodurans]MED3655703.1 ribokinase [Heyndrickxia sporothermodurans]MED3698515.1 ribokinase [Heyndrickxia sporothermodurans]MED3780545.1 ribokinase [Heyndrickxia sporothermodurans]